MNRLNIGKDLYLKGRIGWRGLSKNEYLTSSEYRIINATALMDGYINWNNCGYISKDRYDESSEIMLQENDILISKDGTLGKIGYVKNMEQPCTVASGIFVLRNIKKEVINFDYLYHILKSNIFKDFIQRNKVLGSTIPHLYQRDLENFELEIPTYDVQCKIAKILNSIDEKIQTNIKINAELESISKTLYDYWFLQFDFPNEEGKPYKSSGGKMVWNEELKRHIPEGWEIQLFNDLVAPSPKIKSIMAPDYKSQGKYPIVDQASDLITGFTDDESYLYENDECVVFGDVTTYFKYINFPFAKGTDGTKIIKSKGNRIPALLFFFLIKDSKLPNIGFARHYKFLRDINVLVPDKKISNLFYEKTHYLMEKRRNCILENQKLAELRDFLLPLLMNGQVTFR